MTLTEAKEAIKIKGLPFSEAHERVEEHNREELAKWYVHAEGVPNLVAREAQKPVFSGRVCHCGGMLVRTGSCETCQSCGYNEGCG